MVLDGAKGLRAAVTTVFGARAEVHCCQWHKRENVVSYLPKSEQTAWRRKLQTAYAHRTYGAAKRALNRLEHELTLRNASAAASLREGLEETLTLHRLAVFPALGRSLKTTNLLENVMARVEERTARVDHWRTSDQKLRWCAAALFCRRSSIPSHQELRQTDLAGACAAIEHQTQRPRRGLTRLSLRCDSTFN